jgi:hypothetical protein
MRRTTPPAAAPLSFLIMSLPEHISNFLKAPILLTFPVRDKRKREDTLELPLDYPQRAQKDKRTLNTE